MSRPRRCRRIRRQPDIKYFKPASLRKCELEEVILSFEEYEAIRLVDYENKDQKKSAAKMEISQPTFHRLLKEARKKIAESIIEGKALRIEGGIYKY
ncbi:DUF134 domain-containing protein [Candidatus Peregrinibacteria bacterium]|nr:DUF134 domain-containing protein [Candidatus Peregrinibacteria bacterium]